MPQWYHNLSPDDCYLVLTDDMDSYYSCRILKKHTGIDIGGFFSFEDGLFLNKEYARNKEPIYVDLSISSGKTFDNHYTFINNPDAVNPNVLKRPYFKKYNGGTLPLVSSLYADLSEYTRYQWMTLLSIDSFYLGYYNKGGAFRDVNIYWFDMLEITDYVVPILESLTADDFAEFIGQEGINEKIRLNNYGELVCHERIELPSGPFELVQPIEKQFMPKWEAVVLYQKHRDKILVSNEIYNGKYVVNLKI